jgi:ABC-type transport system involved in cytochrome c biogenesis permease subunit
MKVTFARAVLLVALLGVAATVWPPARSGAFDLPGFGRMPVLADGRIKPWDTVARTALLMFGGRQRLDDAAGHPVAPVAWLLDVLFRPARADDEACFRIDQPDVLSLFGLTPADGSGGVRFTFHQLQAGLAELDRQARLAAPVEALERTSFQRAVVVLRERLEYYGRLKFSLQPPDRPDWTAELADAARLRADRSTLAAMDTFSPLRAVPPTRTDLGAFGQVDPGAGFGAGRGMGTGIGIGTGTGTGTGTGAGADGWRSVGRALLEADSAAPIARSVLTYAELGAAWRDGDARRFNAALASDRAASWPESAADLRRCALEARFNAADPFTLCLALYVAAFLAAVLSWLKWPEALGRAAFALTTLAFVVTTLGLGVRMWLEGRPPVTNLYSSALFIGWGSVGLCLVLESNYRKGVATAAGSLIGFGTLVIAHHLASAGDTLEMMRAVLDSNFWLSTHVVAVTTGYAATFLAGFLAVVYLVRGVCTRSLDPATAAALAGMVYGIVCFATLFSFVGTVLGGIWADQSWGRFWGWDPKENGALLIVLWNAIILHARWGGLVRRDGLMAMAVFGNVVTAWSWFGTNMLGVGLHSYGFTDAAFRGLILFAGSQLVIIALAAVPRARWRSGPGTPQFPTSIGKIRAGMPMDPGAAPGANSP